MNVSLSAIEVALRDEDVEGLIELGAPDDEYEHEAKEITGAISAIPDGQLTEANVVAVISVAWTRAFNYSGQEIEMRLAAFHRIANKILRSAVL